MRWYRIIYFCDSKNEMPLSTERFFLFYFYLLIWVITMIFCNTIPQNCLGKFCCILIIIVTLHSILYIYYVILSLYYFYVISAIKQDEFIIHHGLSADNLVRLKSTDSHYVEEASKIADCLFIWESSHITADC